MKPSEQGSFFRAGRNESEQWYAMDQNLQKHKYLSRDINVSAFEPSEQGSFVRASQHESK